MTGDGTAGTLNGLKSQATDFAYGSTNLSALDVLALSIAQLSVGEYVASGFILHPLDWWSSNLRLKKTTTGEYLLGDPQAMGEPRLWGLPCVITNSQTRGQFTTLDAAQAGFIADREGANMRIAEQHADFFIRNLCALLVEERISLVIERASAIIDGSLDYAG